MTYIKTLGISHRERGELILNVECLACGKIYKLRRIRAYSNVSCGCMNKVTHGEERNRKKSPELSVYTKMRDWCLNPNSADYKNYGGRGIKISNDWLTGFNNFLKDMDRRPTPTSTIERVDVNGDYCKENCIWLEKKLQNKNTRRSHYISYNGDILIMSDMLKKYDVPKTIFYRKLKLGMTEIDIIDQYRRK